MDHFIVTMKNGIAVIEMKGDIVKGEFVGIHERLGELTREGARGFIFDLSGAEFMDSSGLSLLLDAKNLAEQNGLPMTLCGLPPKIYDVLDRLGVEKVFKIIRDKKRAIEKMLE